MLTVAETMSPDTIEARFAALQAEVRSWEHQLRSQGSLIAAHERLDERMGGLRRDLDGLRNEINSRLHELHDEHMREMRREVENLHARMTRIVERRDDEMKDIGKRIGDVTLALKEDIDDCRAFAGTLLADQTSKRGQNLALIAAIITGLLVVLNGILTQVT